LRVIIVKTWKIFIFFVGFLKNPAYNICACP
jgi:hypothetical protein